MADTPQRVQLSRKKGWRMPPNTVSVARPGRWGNPFAAPYVWPELAVELFRDMLTWGFDPAKLQHLSDADFHIVHAAKEAWSKRLGCGVEHHRAARAELAGKNLACWCRLCPAHADGKPFGEACANCAPCHADILGELSNAR